MRETVTHEYCDICGEETKTKRFDVLTYRTHDDMDGHSYNGEIKYEPRTLDFCKECQREMIVVKNIGVQCDKFEIRPISDDEN